MEIINTQEWKRAQHFNFFKNMDYPQYNICMNIDITNFLKKTKEQKLPFYYAMIYAVMTAANEMEEFRYRIRGEQVVLHDRLHPSFTEKLEGEEYFKIVTLELGNTPEEFISTARQKAKEQKAYFPFEELGRDDLIYITCIPWISFTHLSHTISLRKDDAVPRISWGKYFKQEDRILLPFSVQVHHAFADGSHVGAYVERLQRYLDGCE